MEADVSRRRVNKQRIELKLEDAYTSKAKTAAHVTKNTVEETRKQSALKRADDVIQSFKLGLEAEDDAIAELKFYIREAERDAKR